jgi:hypothetical protein
VAKVRLPMTCSAKGRSFIAIAERRGAELRLISQTSERPYGAIIQSLPAHPRFCGRNRHARTHRQNTRFSRRPAKARLRAAINPLPGSAAELPNCPFWYPRPQSAPALAGPITRRYRSRSSVAAALLICTHHATPFGVQASRYARPFCTLAVKTAGFTEAEDQIGVAAAQEVRHPPQQS